MAPPITVVIPTRDRPELVRQAIGAVLDQDYEGRVTTLVVHEEYLRTPHGANHAIAPSAPSPTAGRPGSLAQGTAGFSPVTIPSSRSAMTMTRGGRTSCAFKSS